MGIDGFGKAAGVIGGIIRGISVEASICACETSEISCDQSAEATHFEVSDEVHLEFCSQLFEVCSQLFHFFASFQFVQGFDAFGSSFLHL
mmetsp:Transcript_26903/g.55424  ORF Transcript_26903/g.55424 Transcript_26903/m.55424 type:complete len:90 (+) Transcript_26903:730-999(+)